MNYTKGEWRAEKIVRDWLVEADGRIVATVNGFPNNETESDTNARLMAVAPDMYEALKKYIRDMYGNRIPDEQSAEYPLFKALAKVEGK